MRKESEQSVTPFRMLMSISASSRERGAPAGSSASLHALKGSNGGSPKEPSEQGAVIQQIGRGAVIAQRQARQHLYEPSSESIELWPAL